MGVAKGLAVTLGLCEDFSGSNATFRIGGVVVQVGGVGDGQRPQGVIVNVWPLKSSMDHHCVSLGDDNADGRFTHSILPFGSNTAVTDGLVVRKDLVNECLALKYAVVSVVCCLLYTSPSPRDS